jgi:hypothetical protein
MRRPGGAVCPAMKPTTGLRNSRVMNAAASCSAVPPISPIMITASVSGSPPNNVSASMKLVPIKGSPPNSDARCLTHADPGQLVNRLVREGAAL